ILIGSPLYAGQNAAAISEQGIVAQEKASGNFSLKHIRKSLKAWKKSQKARGDADEPLKKRAVWSLVLVLGGLALVFVPGINTVGAIAFLAGGVLGLVTRSKLRGKPHLKKWYRMATASAIISGLGMLAVIVALGGLFIELVRYA
ncbi:MAG: hypothetical protein AAFP92_29140, partial [Bacteroidota bacterium]